VQGRLPIQDVGRWPDMVVTFVTKTGSLSLTLVPRKSRSECTGHMLRNTGQGYAWVYVMMKVIWLTD
jgi:hypothetical protein